MPNIASRMTGKRMGIGLFGDCQSTNLRPVNYYFPQIARRTNFFRRSTARNPVRHQTLPPPPAAPPTQSVGSGFRWNHNRLMHRGCCPASQPTPGCGRLEFRGDLTQGRSPCYATGRSGRCPRSAPPSPPDASAQDRKTPYRAVRKYLTATTFRPLNRNGSQTPSYSNWFIR